MMPSSGFFSRLCQILSGRDQTALDRKRKGPTETNSIDPKRARTDNSDWHFDTLYGGGELNEYRSTLRTATDPMMAFSKSVRMLSDITDESAAAGGVPQQTSSRSSSTMMRKSGGIGRPSFLKPLDKAVPLNKRSLAELPMLIPLKPRPQKPPLITPSYLPDEPPFQTSSRRSSLASQSTKSGYQQPPASIYPFTGLTMKPPPASRFLPSELNDSDFGQLLRKSYGSTRSVYERLVNGGKSSYDSGESHASRTKYEELMQHVIPSANDQTSAATRRGQYTEFGLNGPATSVRQPQQDTIYLTDDDDDDDDGGQEEDEAKCENQDETSYVTANNGTFPRRPGSERFFSMNAPPSLFDFDGQRQQQQEEEQEDHEPNAGSADKSHAADPVGEMVNSFKEKLQTNTYYRENVIKDVQQRYGSLFETRKTQIEQERERLSSLKQGTVEQENLMRSKMLNYVASMPSFDSLVIEEPPKEVTPKDVPLPELTPEQLTFIRRKLQTGAHALVIDKFKIQITGDAFRTLDGNTWLNDEVINFYMQLLQYRSEQRRDQGLPKVYSKSTFFLSSLRRSGYSGVRRYTKKVDLFSFDLIVVPVHVNEVHWCMAIIDLRRKAIEYYDSLGAPNNPVLDMLENYLCQESMDKRQVPFDKTGLTKRNMSECPKQNNGSDCGVFSCMFAEFLTRDHPITFNQSRMQYFRRKMMLEIAQGELIT
ncbi:sentrin-specific protease 2-like [Anopheles aquasalis]|uniref:sentrin-specific protease 2-like n=1 Tax=Anopheles aquasalis TaxID=42839 RepID=UPI00215AA7F1|nr:sentrin-specific protease 2-like [Anopheles aquasalis]